MLNRDERDFLRTPPHVLRFGDGEGETTTPIKAEQLLVPRVMATVPMTSGQSGSRTGNAIKGGLRGVGRDNSESRAASSPAP
jgi:hypothetical protein